MATQTKAKTTGTPPAATTDVCSECPRTPLDPTTTVYGCEHGTWTFTPDADATPDTAVSHADMHLADLLDSLTAEQLQAALDAKAAAAPAQKTSDEAAKSKTPAKA